MWAGSEHCREDVTDRKPFFQKVGSLKCIFRKSDAWRLLKRLEHPEQFFSSPSRYDKRSAQVFNV